MHLPAHGLSVVFNGEIYNFRELREELEQKGYCFRSHSDTEVLLSAYDAWGSDWLNRLNGMFALALYDSRRGTLLLARDRAGEKPLFYHLSQGTLSFASELKALMANSALPRRIDPVALDCYLAMGFVPGERCILEGFNKLPPAHTLSFDLAQGTASLSCYWRLPDLEPRASSGAVDDDVLLDELEVLLEDAVDKQTVADVPVGVLLSGGVDSSLVTAMAVRRSSKVRTFSIGFPGAGKADETDHARLIARHFDTEHTELMAEPTTADLIPRLVPQFDEPMADSSMIPTWLVSNLVRQHCTVALGGDGGDELFAGYPMHQRVTLLERYFGRIPLALRKTQARLAEAIMPVGVRGRNFLLSLGYDYTRHVPHFQELFGPRLRMRLLPHLQAIGRSAEDVRRDRTPSLRDPLQRATRFDFQNYLAEDVLVKVDRASMLNSLEVRAPLLDFRMIEFAFGKVPSRLKATPRDKKILLKRLAARVLPKEFDRQRKQGFSIPLAKWLRGGPFRELFWDVLGDRQCLFDRHTIEGLLRGQDSGRRNGERLFALVQLELWRREYDICV